MTGHAPGDTPRAGAAMAARERHRATGTASWRGLAAAGDAWHETCKQLVRVASILPIPAAGSKPVKGPDQ
jgi:hypothetical protein